jgi:hypothetical protein
MKVVVPQTPLKVTLKYNHLNKVVKNGTLPNIHPTKDFELFGRASGTDYGTEGIFPEPRRYAT